MVHKIKKEKLGFSVKGINPFEKVKKDMWLEYHFVFEGEHMESEEENIRGKTLAKVMRELMHDARVGNADYVHWDGLYEKTEDFYGGGEPTLGHRTLTKIAVKVSE